jgi:hypothetical protein
MRTYTRESNAENSCRNFAESTFITKMNPDEATAEIRIFTPVKCSLQGIQLLGRHGY